MSKKKKKQKFQPPSAPGTGPKPSSVPLPSPAAPSIPSSESFARQMTFDSIEDRVLGEEQMLLADSKKIKEEESLKKDLKAGEVDRRLAELRKQLGIKK